MNDDEANEIGVTLLQLVQPGVSPRELLRLVRKQHPKARKRNIVLAAFAAILAIADSDLERALLLQNFAIRSRGAED